VATLDIRPQREQRRRMRLTPPLLWSAGFHLTVLLLLLITMRHRETSEPLPPPGVAMVFESGSARGPRLPNPTREANLPPQPAAVPSPLAPAPPPEAAPPASAAAQPSRATSPLPVPPVPPQAAGATTQEAEAPPLISAPLAEPAPPPSPAKPVAPNQQAMVTPPLPARPLTPPAPQTAPRTPSPEAAPRAPAPPAQSARKSNGAPPMRLFAQSLPSLSKFSVGPALRGPTEIMPFAKISAAALGADWRNELAAWIEAHKYYPQAAAERGEQGVSEVRVVVNRDGHVESVELERQSGYQALDSGAVGLFHGAELPPFPIGTNEERVTIDLTIHYVIYRN
jgi:TonB family protein